MAFRRAQHHQEGPLGVMVRGTGAYTDHETSALVLGARRGDATCWEALVDRFGPLVWTVARSCNLSAADAAETSQTVWLRLAESLDAIKHPERLGAWIVTTARRESIRQHRLRSRETLGAEQFLEYAGTPAADVDVLGLLVWC